MTAEIPIGDLIPTKIPGYSDDADIQAALRLYHYGSYTYTPSNTSPSNLVSPSIAKTIYDIQQSIATLGVGTINQNIFTAKGQILTATASNSPSVLSVGTNNQFLIANSATGTGLQWTNTLTAPSVITPTISGGVTLTGSTTGSTVLQASSSASGTITLPAVTGTVVTTGDTGTVTNTMLAGSIANNKLVNSSITINGTPVSLGGSISLPGDIEGVTAGTGLTGGGTSGTVTLSIDTTVVATTNNTLTMSNKTLTSPIINLSLNPQTGTTFIPALSDNGKLVTLSNTSAITVTVPTNTTVSYATGAQINLLQLGAGQVTVVGDTGVTVYGTPGLKFRAQYSAATLIKLDTDTWLLTGDLSQ